MVDVKEDGVNDASLNSSIELGLEGSILERTQGEVVQCFLLLAKYIGIKLEGHQVPSVVVQVAECSFFSQFGNIISIKPDCVGRGPTYFEEASHALRNFISINILREKDSSFESMRKFHATMKAIMDGQQIPENKAEGLTSVQFQMVEEFIGRLGEDTGRALVRENVQLNYLFKDVAPRNFKQVLSEVESRYKNIELLCVFYKIKDQYFEVIAELQQVMVVFLDKMKEMANSFTTDTYMEEFSGFVDLIFEVMHDRSKMPPESGIITDEIEEDLEEFVLLAREVNTILKSNSDLSGRFQAVKKWCRSNVSNSSMRRAMSRMRLQHCKVRTHDFLHEKFDHIQEDTRINLVHDIGYISAEELIDCVGGEKELLELSRAIYLMPSIEIFEKYIRNSKVYALYGSFMENAQSVQEGSLLSVL